MGGRECPALGRNLEVQTAVIDHVAAIDDLLCDGCRECLDDCPSDGLEWDEEARLVIVADPFACDGCGECVPGCPAGALHLVPRRC